MCVFSSCIYLVHVLLGGWFGLPLAAEVFTCARLRWCSGDDPTPDQLKILELPQDNPIILPWLSKS